MRPIQDVASDLGFVGADVQPWGPDVLKVRPEVAFRDDPSGRGWSWSRRSARRRRAKARPPAPSGSRRPRGGSGVSAACALREPSLGPVFGLKGGGTGGGKSTLEPSARINLHFTGDIHAITSAHNLLAALVDNHIYFRTPAGPGRARSRGR